MAIDLSDSDKKTKLTALIESSVYTLEEIKETRANLTEQIKDLAEETGIPVKTIRLAIRIALKNSLKEDREDFDDAVEILEAAGRA